MVRAKRALRRLPRGMSGRDFFLVVGVNFDGNFRLSGVFFLQVDRDLH